MKKALAILYTLLIFFVIPIGLAYLYILNITVDKFYTPIGIEKTLLNPQQVETGSSTSTESHSYSTNTDPSFQTLDNATLFLGLFDVKPELIKHSLYIDISKFKARIEVKNANEETLAAKNFDLTLVCDGQDISATSSNNKNYLLKSGLVLNGKFELNDRAYIEKIFSNCLERQMIKINNDDLSGEIGSVDPVQSLPGGIRVIIVPESISQIALYLGFFVFWVGLLLLLREGPWKFYIWHVRSRR